MDNVPRSDASVNYYAVGLKWARPDHTGLTVIPGMVHNKAPHPCIKTGDLKPFMRSNCRTPNYNEMVKWRTAGIGGYDYTDEHDVRHWNQTTIPLLILDSRREAMSLCVIDVDYAPKLQMVEQELVANGIDLSKCMYVATGRDGGGTHIYFRRDPKTRWQYQSQNSNSLFGTHAAACRKCSTITGCGVCNTCGGTGEYQKNSIDLKAMSSYVVCPGAIHKTGRIYTATINGVVVEDLYAVIDQIAVMPLELWQKLRIPKGGHKPGYTEDSYGNELVDIDNADPILSTIIRQAKNGIIRQVCPWCVARNEGDATRGKPNLVVDLKRRKASCWNCNKTHRWVVIGDEAKAALAEVLADLPSSGTSASCLPGAKEEEEVTLGPSGQNIQDIEGSGGVSGLGPKGKEEVTLGPSPDDIEESDIIIQAKVGYGTRVSDTRIAEVKAEQEEIKARKVARDPFAHLLAGLIDSQEDMEVLEDSTLLIHALFERPMYHKCEFGLTFAVGKLYNHGGSEATSRNASCWAYRCPSCFPYLAASLASAIEAYIDRAVTMGWNVKPMIADWDGHNTKARKNAMALWSGIEGREWLGIRTGVNEIHYLLITKRGVDVTPPTALVKAATRTDNNLVHETIRSTVNAIVDTLKTNVVDIAATGCVMNLVLGTRRACGTIKGLQDAVTGKSRTGTRGYGKKLLNKALEKADGVKAEGIESDVLDSVTVATRNHKGVFAAVRAATGAPVTEEDPTGGGVFPGSTPNRIVSTQQEHNLVAIIRAEATPDGLLPPVHGGHTRNKKVRDAVAAGNTAGVKMIPIATKSLEEALDDQGI